MVLAAVTTGTVAAGGAADAATGVDSSAVTTPVKAPVWPVKPREPMDARDLMSWVSRAELVKRSALFTTTTPTSTITGVRTFVEHVGLEADLRVVKGAGPKRAIIIDGWGYFPLAEPLDGKHWVRSDSTSTDPALAPLDRLRDQLSSRVDPVVGWGWYVGRMPVTRGRQRKLDGVRTTPYTFHKNEQQLIADLPLRQDDPDAASLRGATAVTTYYVDAHGLPYRIVEVVTRKNKRYVTTVVLRRWGTKVTVPVPAPSDVTQTLPVGTPIGSLEPPR